jgi:hypothetical protein
MLENAYAILKYKKSLRNQNEGLLLKNDPILGNHVPDMSQLEYVKNDTSIHPEIRKVAYSNQRENDRNAGPITNLEEA